MALFVKMSNGGVSILVNINNQSKIEEKKKLGFEVVLDEDGEVVTVDSRELIKTKDKNISELLEKLKGEVKREAKVIEEDTEDVDDII